MFVSRGFRGGNGGGGFGVEFCGCIGLGFFFFLQVLEGLLSRILQVFWGVSEVVMLVVCGQQRWRFGS